MAVFRPCPKAHETEVAARDLNADSAEEAPNGSQTVGARDPAQELEHYRMIVHDLRNPVGSAGMAVEMLVRAVDRELASVAEQPRQRIREILDALSESLAQLRHLVSRAAPVAEVEPQRRLPSAPLALAAKAEVPANTPPARANGEPASLEQLMQRLEVLTVTRSALPALLSVQCEAGLHVHCEEAELLRALSNLVENGIEASARQSPDEGPWTVEVKGAWADGKVRIEVENRGANLSKPLREWLASPDDGVPIASSKEDSGLHGVGLRSVRRVVECAGGTLSAKHRRGVTSFCVTLRGELREDSL